MEPPEAQYLIINALDTLKLLIHSFYDEDNGSWTIQTPSPILPTARILHNGDIIPINF